MRNFILSFVCTISCFQLSAQCNAIEDQMNEVYKIYYTSDLTEFINAYDDLAKKVEDEKCWTTLLDIHVYRTECATLHFEFEKADRFALEAEEVFLNYVDSLSQEDHFYYYQLHTASQINNSYQKGNYQEAEIWSEKALENYNDTLDQDTKSVFVSYYQYIAKVYEAQLRYKEAESMYKKALVFSKNLTVPAGQEHHNHTKKLLADLYSRYGSIEIAEKLYKESLAFDTDLYQRQKKKGKGIESKVINRLIHKYIKLAEVKYKKNKQYEISEEYLEKALVLSKKHSNTQIIEINDTYGDLEADRKKFQKALYYYKESAAKSKKNIPKHASTLTKLAEISYQMGDLDATENYSEQIKNLLQEKNLSFMVNETILARLYELKGNIEFDLYEKQAKVSNLENAFGFYEQAIEYIKGLQPFFYDDDDKLLLANSHRALFSSAIKVGFLLGEDHWEKALQIADFAKATKLRASISHQLASYQSDIPETKKLKERKLRQIIAQKTKGGENTFDEEKKLKGIVEDYRKDHPQYFKDRFEDIEISVSQIQNSLLSAKEAIISYYLAGDYIYIWYISSNKFNMYQVSSSLEFNNSVGIFSSNSDSSIVKPNSPKEDPDTKSELVESTNFLYNTLVKPISLENEKRIEHITIVPDSIISNIPFDILSPQQGSKLKMDDFLIQKYSLSYAHSIWTLNQSKRDERNTETVYFLGALSADSSERLKKIEKILRQKIKDKHLFLEANAAKFKSIAPLYRLLVVGAHTDIYPDNPIDSRLLLGANKQGQKTDLSFLELRSQSLSAEMIILLSCASASDSQNNDEALAYAFNYAGIKSFIAPLWKCPDPATAEITNDLIKYMIRGHSKAEALRKAKLNYINNNRSQKNTLHPFFWSSLVQFGDHRAIENIPLGQKLRTYLPSFKKR